MDCSEKAAKIVLEAALPGAKLTYRRQQSHGEYDFDLQYPDGRLAAVEATISVDRLQMQTAAAIHSRKKSPVISVSKLKSTWWITPAQNANINAIRSRIETCLATLEEAGIDEFSAFEIAASKQYREADLQEAFPDKIVSQCVESMCNDLMLQSGGVISPDGPPKIILGHPSYGGAVGADCAINAGKAEAWKEDIRKKLGAAQQEERHVVIFVHPANGLAYTALADCDPPPTLPELPPEVDQIWLLGDLGGPDAGMFVVWRATKTTRWQKLEIAVPAVASPVQSAC